MPSLSAYLSSPREASQIFDLDGSSAPRPKNLFFVRFTRANSTTAVTSTTTSTTGSTSTWLKDLSFVIKSVDRPAQQPQVEELKQYNKTRVIQTGIKYSPVRMTIYDTADSLAHQMWSEYSRHYFGTYRHDQSPNDFLYDVTTPQFNDTNNQGFGFSPQAESNSSLDDNTQFFFDRISVYQVFGGKYLQFDLVNPKISSFDPDDFNYEESNVGTINLTITYEAIIYQNQGKPQALSAASGLTEAFGEARMDSGVVDYDDEGATTGLFATAAATATTASLITALTSGAVDSGAVQAALASFASSISGGSLAAYGLYNFGSTTGPTTYNTPSLASDLIVSALANPALASALSISSGQVLSPQIASLTAPYAQSSGLPAAAYDVAAGAVNATAVSGDATAAATALNTVINAVMAAASANGSTSREQIYPLGTVAASTGTRSAEEQATFDRLKAELATYGIALQDNAGTSLDATQAPNTWNSASANGGLILSPQAYAILNAQRSTTSQIGFNSQSGGSSNG
jgi:hypothetical protein